MKVRGAEALQDKVIDAPRILIVRVGAMGDVIHALPAVAMLRAALPEAQIGWAVEPRWAPLLRAEGATERDPERMPLVDAVHLVEAKRWNQRPLSLTTALSIAALRRELRRVRYDIAIDLQGTLRSAVIARMSGARSVVGSSGPREPIARYLYRSNVLSDAVHVVDQAIALVKAALAEPVAGKEPAMLPPLPRDGAATAWWDERRAALPDGRPLVLLAATAGWGAKEWPAHRFAALASRLVEAGHSVLLNTPPDRADAQTSEVLRVAQASGSAVAQHVHPLPATLPQLIAATRDVKAVIAGDTGPLHLAAALGVPLVGLFGPTSPERTGPRNRAFNLRHATSVTDHRRHSDTEAGLERLTVDEVLAAFESVTGAR